jgi:Tuberculosis necrotizing toxin
MAPEGTPFAQLALPPDSALKPYFQYVVNEPTALPPGWHIEQSQVAPWFHQPGGGTQYRIIAPPGERASVERLLQSVSTDCADCEASFVAAGQSFHLRKDGNWWTIDEVDDRGKRYNETAKLSPSS